MHMYIWKPLNFWLWIINNSFVAEWIPKYWVPSLIVTFILSLSTLARCYLYNLCLYVCCFYFHRLSGSYSPLNNYKGLFRDVPASGKTQKKQLLEVWRGNKLWKCYDLTSMELHGDVCTDGGYFIFILLLCISYLFPMHS